MGVIIKRKSREASDLEAELEYDARLEQKTTGDERALGRLGKLGRRGRPKVLGGALLEEYAQSFPSGATRRTILNMRLELEAIGVLELCSERDDNYIHRDAATKRLQHFLCGDNTRQAYRAGVLVEIGRIAERFGHSEAKAAAIKLMDHFRGRNTRVTTREMVAWLRNQRLHDTRAKRPAKEGGLAKKLWDVITEHRRTHPDEQWYDVQSAIEKILQDVEAEQEAEAARYRPPS